MNNNVDDKLKHLLSKIFTKEEVMEIVMYAIKVDDNYLFRHDLVRERIQRMLTEKNKQLENDILKTKITDFPFEESFKVIEMYDKARKKKNGYPEMSRNDLVEL